MSPWQKANIQGSFCISNFERDPRESYTKLQGMMGCDLAKSQSWMNKDIWKFTFNF